MKEFILLLASKMLNLASDEFSNHSCNDLPGDTLTMLKMMVNEKEFCAKFREWKDDNGEYPQSFEQIGDSSLMEFLAEELRTLSDLCCQ